MLTREKDFSERFQFQNSYTRMNKRLSVKKLAAKLGVSERQARKMRKIADRVARAEVEVEEIDWAALSRDLERETEKPA